MHERAGTLLGAGAEGWGWRGGARGRSGAGRGVGRVEAAPGAAARAGGGARHAQAATPTGGRNASAHAHRQGERAPRGGPGTGRANNTGNWDMRGRQPHRSWSAGRGGGARGGGEGGWAGLTRPDAARAAAPPPSRAPHPIHARRTRAHDYYAPGHHGPAASTARRRVGPRAPPTSRARCAGRDDCARAFAGGSLRGRGRGGGHGSGCRKHKRNRDRISRTDS